LSVVRNIEQGTQPNLTGNDNRSDSNWNDRNDSNEREIAVFYNAMFQSQGGNLNNLMRQFIQGNGRSTHSGGNVNQSVNWNNQIAQQYQGQGQRNQGFELGVSQNNFYQDLQQVANNEQSVSSDRHQEWDSKYGPTGVAYQNRG
jgi:hypothetical protein